MKTASNNPLTGFLPKALYTSLLGVAIYGCGQAQMVIKAPTKNSTMTCNGTPPACSVPVFVQWTGAIVGPPDLVLDSVLIPNALTQQGTGTITAAPGPHLITTGGTIFINGSFTAVGDACSFTIIPPTPSLVMLPSSGLTLTAGNSGTITVSTINTVAAPVFVTLSPNNANVALGTKAAGVSDSITISAGSNSQTEPVKGLLSGVTAIAAAATGFLSTNMTIGINPVLTGLQITSGPPGTNVPLIGQGFIPGAQAKFGGTITTATYTSSSQLSATVPQVSPATVNVQVLAANRSSNSLAFSVTSAPAPKVIVFRSSGTDVQSFGFTNSSTWAPIDTKPATLSSGLWSVGLALNGGGQLLRASSVDVQSFPINSDFTLSPPSSVSSVLSGSGVAMTAVGATAIRASDSGIQAFQASPLQAKGTLSSTPATSGVGIDLFGTVAVRADGGGIETFNVSNINALVKLGSTIVGGLTSSAPDVKIFAAGTRAIRSYDGGIEVYDISNPSSISLLGSKAGGSAPTGSAVVVDAAGSLAVRVYGGGIETYSISTPSNIVRLGVVTNVALSSTGVGVCLKGTIAFRGTDSVIEAYDISNPNSLTLLGQPVQATLSSTGVGLRCQ